MNKVFDGKKSALYFEKSLSHYFSKLDKSPTLGIIQVGDDRLSNIFINEKIKFAKKIGVNINLKKFSEGFKGLDKEIIIFNKDPNISAFLLQLPLVGIKNSKMFLEKIVPTKDIDCLVSTNYSKALMGDSIITPGVFTAFRYIFEKLNIPKDSHILIIGGGFVGKLILNYLSDRKFNVTIVDKFVSQISEYSKSSDVIISSANVSSIVSRKDVKDGGYFINIGAASNFDGKIMGGITDDVIDKAKFFVPSIGGIGPLTVAMLFYNLKSIIDAKTIVK